MNGILENKILKKLTNDTSEELINLMKEYKISDSTIMLTIMGIGTHTAYYRVLYNRIQNNKDKITEEYIKKLVIELFKEIDRNNDFDD